MKNKLQKALSLTKKTGDRLIVFDLSQNIDPFVVMNLNEYEKIIIGKSEVRGLTEDELLDKINRDIAVWRSEQSSGQNRDKKAGSFVPVENIINRRERRWDENYKLDESDDESFEDEFEDYEDYKDHKNDFQNLEKENKHKKSPWRIPSERKQAAEEVIEEDRQYLEKIKY
jgi:hypothetical protein